jgi:nicotinate-nucleotide--dimethylbenzimidazole phosphoribosyltransferase
LTGGRPAWSARGVPEPIADTVAAVRPVDLRARAAAAERLDRMTKPRGALGRVEDVAVALAGIAGECPPPVPEPAAVAIFAGDHGVHAQGVTPWPQEVTAQMVANFLAGGAVVNAFARQLGADVRVVDVGVRAPLDPHPDLWNRRVADGTADMTAGPAMTRGQVLRAVEVGVETARELVADGHRCLITGDMGIANTTPAAALIAAFTGADPHAVTGLGTGIDSVTHARKVAVVTSAVVGLQADEPLGILAAVGGLEHAALTGFILGAAARRTPVLLDGVIAVSAAVVAHAFAPQAVNAMVAGHRSAEPGATVALAHLGLEPLVDLGLRLGEGTGAALALPIAASAVRVLHDVATFDSAGVAKK